MELDPLIFGADQPCFGCAPGHPTGFRLRFVREEGAVVTRFMPTEAHQGPPGLMHGGLVMTLADEVGAWAIVGLLGKFGFTAQFAGRLKRPVRVGVEVEGRGVILKPGPRVVSVGVVLGQAGETVMEAQLGFVLMDASGAQRMLGGPLPPAWETFCR